MLRSFFDLDRQKRVRLSKKDGYTVEELQDELGMEIKGDLSFMHKWDIKEVKEKILSDKKEE